MRSLLFAFRIDEGFFQELRGGLHEEYEWKADLEQLDTELICVRTLKYVLNNSDIYTDLELRAVFGWCWGYEVRIPVPERRQ